MTRRTLYGLALAFLAALTGPALGQSIILPGNSVYGRLAIGTGPGQAIPLATLVQQFSGVLGGVSVANPGTGALEALYPIQTATGASKVFVTADLFKLTERSNSGAAMSDTFPASTAIGMALGTPINFANIDASATATITAGAGSTINGGATDTVGPGRTVRYVYNANTANWERAFNSASVLLGPNNLSDVASVSTARTNLGLGTMATQNANAVAVTGGTITGATISGGSLAGTISGTPTLSGANFVANSNLAQSGAATLKMNATAGTANSTDTKVSALTDIGTPSGTLDWLLVEDHVAGTIKKVNPSGLTAAVGSGVTSLNGQTGALVIATTPGMRITATSATPITESDVTAATALYLTPTDSINTMIYDGTNWVPRQYSGELTYTLTAGNNTANNNYDLFETYDSGSTAVVICSGPAWTSATARGTGAGTTEVEFFNGRLTNKNSMTCKNNASTYTVGVHQGNLRGSFGVTGTNGQTEDSALNRLVCDLYRPMPRPVSRVDTTDTWTWTTAGWHQANASTANQVTWFSCVAGRPVNLRLMCEASSSNGTPVTAACAVGIDSTTTPATSQVREDLGLSSTYNQFGSYAHAEYNGFPSLGRHTGVWLEFGGTAVTFYGDNGTTTKQTGLIGTVYQ